MKKAKVRCQESKIMFLFESGFDNPRISRSKGKTKELDQFLLKIEFKDVTSKTWHSVGFVKYENMNYFDCLIRRWVKRSISGRASLNLVPLRHYPTRFVVVGPTLRRFSCRRLFGTSEEEPRCTVQYRLYSYR